MAARADFAAPLARRAPPSWTCSRKRACHSPSATPADRRLRQAAGSSRQEAAAGAPGCYQRVAASCAARSCYRETSRPSARTPARSVARVARRRVRHARHGFARRVRRGARFGRQRSRPDGSVPQYGGVGHGSGGARVRRSPRAALRVRPARPRRRFVLAPAAAADGRPRGAVALLRPRWRLRLSIQPGTGPDGRLRSRLPSRVWLLRSLPALHGFRGRRGQVPAEHRLRFVDVHHPWTDGPGRRSRRQRAQPQRRDRRRRGRLQRWLLRELLLLDRAGARRRTLVRRARDALVCPEPRAVPELAPDPELARTAPRRRQHLRRPPELPLVPEIVAGAEGAEKTKPPGLLAPGGHVVWLRNLLSDLPDVRRLRPLGTLGDLVLHLLTFREAPEALHLDGGVVDEHVFAASVWSDEAVAFRVIEPLHGTCSHSGSAFRKRLPRGRLGAERTANCRKNRAAFSG